MKKYYTADRETGTIIDEFKTIALALEAIDDYEEQDREDGTYEPNFYDIVDEDHCHVDQFGWYLVDQTGYDRWETRLDAETQEDAIAEAKSEWECMSEHDRNRAKEFYICWARETVEGFDDESADKIVDIMNL